MVYPTREEALALLEWAHGLNPGPWREHSLGVARAGEKIAEALSLDTDRAWINGCLHDIGRFEGPRGMHHVIAGYDLCVEKGWDGPARACMVHSFPNKDFEGYTGAHDVSAEEEARIRAFIAGCAFDDYDRLMQLGDAISWGDGVCLMEKRLVNVVMRYNDMGPRTLDKWRAWFAIKEDFERRMGRSLYSLFPEAAENTLG